MCGPPLDRSAGRVAMAPYRLVRKSHPNGDPFPKRGRRCPRPGARRGPAALRRAWLRWDRAPGRRRRRGREQARRAPPLSLQGAAPRRGARQPGGALEGGAPAAAPRGDGQRGLVRRGLRRTPPVLQRGAGPGAAGAPRAARPPRGDAATPEGRGPAVPRGHRRVHPRGAALGAPLRRGRCRGLSHPRAAAGDSSAAASAGVLAPQLGANARSRYDGELARIAKSSLFGPSVPPLKRSARR